MQATLPYIVTLLLDEDTSRFFDALRKNHFPPARNYLPAHLTLFHHLPSTEEKIKTDLQRWAAQTKAFALRVTSVVGTGKGVAYKTASSELLTLHKAMQREWQPWLTPQDRQTLWPHVTVQNKVSPAVAKQTLQLLQKDFGPFTVQALGFALWYYEGGPWRFAAGYNFA